MLVLDISNLKKYYGDRLILDIKDLKIYKDDKIGVVGLNGSGKTTLLNLISKEILPDEGYIRTFGNISYIKQLEHGNEEIAHGKYISELGLKGK